ncbi:hypothetical protein EGW08_011972 [Elysia chlorotica]|uniref:Uncharacterized protein n=1 Tax=Elysia chlorotica TaxID=188477 RepID=A0A3S1HIS8_ELYCH|nr:hypothetical protein EGW08_011972 [Elysia chlorotica]
MFSSTVPSFVAYIMGSIQQLDPTLAAFWQGFPCPPPWKEELLFRLNWTGCVGVEVGEMMRSFMADKCNIRHDGKRILPDLVGGSGKDGGGSGADAGRGGDGLMVEEDCGLPCQIVVSVICVLFLALLFIAVVVCVRRHRSKSSSPSHQSSLTAHPDGTKYYTSCHYACAPVVGRQLQTSMNGERTETSVLPPSVTGANGHYQPGSYPQHSCVQANYEHHHLLIPHHPHHHHHHRQLQQQAAPRLINTPYGPVPAHTSSIIVPNQHFSIPGQPLGYPYSLRKLDGNAGGYSSTSGNSNSDPVYESIDSDSARHTSLSEEGYCEYCDCGRHPGQELHDPRPGLPPNMDMGVAGLVPVSSTGGEPFPLMQHERPAFFNSGGGNNNFFASEQFQKQLNGKDLGDNVEGNYVPASEIDLPNSHTHEDPPTPCPPMAGYYGDSGPQTLPLRPLRTKPYPSRDESSERDRGQSLAGGRGHMANPEELVPLNMSDGPVFPTDDSALALLGMEASAASGQSMRRRPTPAKREGPDVNDSGFEGSTRRPIPSLHPHYFLANSTASNS